MCSNIKPIKLHACSTIKIFLPSSCGNSWQNTAIDVLMPPEIPELPPSANAAPMAKPSLMLWRVSPIMIIQATVDIFFRGFLIPSSLLNTERRDKLCLRLFLGLPDASWGSASPLISPLAFCLKEKSILCTWTKYISAWFFSAMSSVRLHF